MYTEILFDDEFDGFKMFDEGSLKNLSRINILIGKNNSGKSRFMRKIFSYEGLNFKTKNSPPLKTVLDSFKKATAVLQERGNHGYLNNLAPILIGINSSNNDNDNDKKHWGSVLSGLDQVKGYFENPRTDKTYVFSKNIMESITALHSVVQLKLSEEYKSIYIPILRGLRPVQMTGETFDTKSDVYTKRTKKDYSLEESDDRVIISGLGFYEETRRLLLGRLSDRNKVRDFEKFISEAFFEGKEFSVVPHDGEDVVYVRIGSRDEDEKPIHKLGDGIQAIIILLYPLFFHQGETCIICFEEPETHLHPGLQRLFIEILRHENFKTFQYFITTHSNHFLDLTADYDDIAVYSFKKDEADTESETFVIENVEDGEGSVLQELGVRASSVFLSNCTIWIEGITDRLYLRKFLEIYQEHFETKQFKEDYHYSFIEYGGNNITHWSFLESPDPVHSNINVDRICKKIFLITDKDGAGLTKDGKAPAGKAASSKKYERHQLLEAKLGDQYFCLDCREIENLLTKEIIKKVVQEKEGENPDLDFKAFDKADYKDEKLGNFIESKVGGIGKTYASDSGTVKDKLNFCKIAVKNIYDINDLSEEAKKLCKAIYNFISKANSL